MGWLDTLIGTFFLDLEMHTSMLSALLDEIRGHGKRGWDLAWEMLGILCDPKGREGGRDGHVDGERCSTKEGGRGSGFCYNRASQVE